MVDLETRTPVGPDPGNRKAALLAAMIAVPVAVIVGVVFFLAVRPDAPAAPALPAASASAPVIVPSTPVPMAVPKLSPRAAQVCLAVTSQLPNTVRNLPARRVSAGPEQNAAWGEPPLTVACGVRQPQMCAALDGGPDCVPLTADLLIMNRVCWYGRTGTSGSVFTTMDREVAVQVTVPAGLENPAQWANEFSDAVVKTVSSKTAGVPSGCGG